ncbi:MAG: HAD family phosphatase, partial [Thermoguttaceae bacterium]|nr:HAD family phosphatase [Thermoguttaceae bacterium]
MTIRFVYFDLGNVLIRFSIQRMLYQLAEILEKSDAEVKAAIFESKRYYAYETGATSTAEFSAQVAEALGVEFVDKDFQAAFNDIFWVNDESLPIARRLAKVDFPRGILSNTNPLHWRYVETAFPRVWRYFPRHKIASCDVKAVKPNAAMYQIAFDEARTELADLRPEEVLFIDDLEPNVLGAREFGFQCFG